MRATYSVGIDLGTTNSVLAYARIEGKIADVCFLAIPQIVAPQQSEALSSLPSFAYLPTEAEKNDGSLGEFGEVCVGSYARKISAEQPERTVAAAKSWLCHREVNRHDPILPWQAPEEVQKLSPVETTTLYLKHLVQSWERAFPEVPLCAQQVTLTVPASFDVVARELTLEAARNAGLPSDLILLEEPQAAIYHWMHTRGEKWRENLSAGDRILVCDCGGGTTDLTLLEVDQEDGALQLKRIAVGNHLLVGGDNMDLAMAHFAAHKFAETGVKLSPWQSIGLWHACRAAKERLLSGNDVQTHPVSVLGRGSRLIGGTVSIELKREEIEQILVDGFFPRCVAQDRPESDASIGLQELGLNYESDTAITKHVAAFLADHRSSADTEPEMSIPSRLLFNGGVFKSRVLKQRMIDVLTSWTQDSNSIEVLGDERVLDLAVAGGAAFYGWSKVNGGVRIRGGIASSFYVGIETSGPAVPGMPRPVQALCVAKQGMEEGTESDIPNRQFGLVVGKPAKFRFFSSHVRPDDEVGHMLKFWDEDELVETNSLEIVLADEATESDIQSDNPIAPIAPIASPNLIPVRFQSKITELGIFELWCVSLRDGRRWKLSFNVRPRT
jgi:Hsp70 protein